MSLFRKKCEYCRTKIEKGEETKRDVKVPGYTGTYLKNFCNDDHADKYEQEIEEYIERSKNHGGCCG